MNEYERKKKEKNALRNYLLSHYQKNENQMTKRYF